MSPPTEQLIRDYLNRLSVAGRARLNAEDRKALVKRTHDFIEWTASRSGHATSMHVAALLARLGDPAVLVSQEVARLAAIRGEPAEPSAAESKRPGQRLGLLRRRSGQASWHWPRLAGSPDLQGQLLNGSRSAADEAAANHVDPPAANGVEAADEDRSATPDQDRSATPDQDRPATPDQDRPAGPDWGLPVADQDAPAGDRDAPAAEPREPPIWVPRQAPAPEALEMESAGRPGESGAVNAAEPGQLAESSQPEPERPPLAGPAGRPSWPSVVAMNAGTSADPEAAQGESATAMPDAEPGGASWPGRQAGTEPVPQRVLRAAMALLGVLIAWARRNPLESLAAMLLGVGGAVYPPVWLLGALVALASRVWDGRDKWVGLAGPVLLLVVGTVAGVSLAHPHAPIGSYLHEGWVYADVLSRVAAVLGTGYLVWRVVHGRRVPAVPPWHKPHKVG